MFKGYPEEIVTSDWDDGTMPDNVDTLKKAVVGHKIVSTGYEKTNKYSWSDYEYDVFTITLDNGKKVQLIDTDDCCAFTELRDFLLDADKVDHIITGVGTTDGYDTWHIYCDMGDILLLQVGWSCGNPFYYGYGFDIRVKDADGSSVDLDSHG